MKKTILSVLLICTLLVSSLFVTAAENTESKYNDEYFARQEKSIIEYNNLLNEIVKKDKNNLKGSFGGAFLDDNGDLIVQLTDDSSDKVKVLVEITKNEKIKTKKCKYTMEELLSIVNYINDNRELLINEGIIIDKMYKDIAANKVYVFIRENNKTKEQSLKKHIKSEALEVFMSEGIKEDHSIDLKAGGSISDDSGDSTLGFCATRSIYIGGGMYQNVEGFVIAGHAPDNIGEVIEFEGTDAGTVNSIKLSGTVDAAFVTAYSSANITNDMDNGYQITSASTYSYPQNTYVKMLGASSGHEGGKILDDSASETFTSGYFTDLVYCDYASIGGDSGAPITIGGSSIYDTLIGIHKGGESYFVKYSNIKSYFNLSAKTN